MPRRPCCIAVPHLLLATVAAPPARATAATGHSPNVVDEAALVVGVRALASVTVDDLTGTNQ
jgi:hypothetical protein